MTCSCGSEMASIGIHQPSCPLFKNFIPNEVIEVQVPAPIRPENEKRIFTFDKIDRDAINQYTLAIELAAKGREALIKGIAAKHGIDMSIEGQCWNFDFPTGVLTRTR